MTLYYDLKGRADGNSEIKTRVQREMKRDGYECVDKTACERVAKAMM